MTWAAGPKHFSPAPEVTRAKGENAMPREKMVFRATVLEDEKEEDKK
nr:MAG TPA: hypothetical protein [Caudoviricetes sp.]